MKLLSESEVKALYDFGDMYTRHYIDSAVEYIVDKRKYYNSVRLDVLFNEGKLKKVKK